MTAEYTIILDDGSEVKANLNENTWESDTEPDSRVFENNTENVKYITPENKTIKLGDCKFIKGANVDDKWLFFLNPLTAEEKREKRILQQIADVEDALCELAEML